MWMVGHIIDEKLAVERGIVIGCFLILNICAAQQGNTTRTVHICEDSLSPGQALQVRGNCLLAEAERYPIA